MDKRCKACGIPLWLRGTSRGCAVCNPGWRCEGDAVGLRSVSPTNQIFHNAPCGPVAPDSWHVPTEQAWGVCRCGKPLPPLSLWHNPDQQWPHIACGWCYWLFAIEDDHIAGHEPDSEVSTAQDCSDCDQPRWNDDDRRAFVARLVEPVASRPQQRWVCQNPAWLGSCTEAQQVHANNSWGCGLYEIATRPAPGAEKP